MDNVEKYISLLVLAGSFIIAALNSKKKAKAQSQQAEAPEEKKITPIPQQKTVVPKKRKLRHPEPSFYNPEEVEPVYSSLTSSQLHPGLSNETISLVEQEENVSFKINMKDMDEVKRAIIYSEIFTRRTY